jgi:hypothetical protein
VRAVRRAALQALEEARLAYQFAPNSYTYGVLAQIELLLVRWRRSSREPLLSSPQ